MKRKLFVIVSLLLVCAMLPLSAMADYWIEGKVVQITSKSAVNVYSKPARTGYLGEAVSGGCYAYLGKSGDWYEIQFTSDITGYVPAKYSAVYNGYVYREDDNGPGAVVVNVHYNNLIIRSGSNKQSSQIGVMPSGSYLPYRGEQNGWYRVESNGEYGYVAGNLCVVVTGTIN